MGREDIPEICQITCPTNDHTLEPRLAAAFSKHCIGPVISFQETADDRVTIYDEEIIDVEGSADIVDSTKGQLACTNEGLLAEVARMQQEYDERRRNL